MPAVSLCSQFLTACLSEHSQFGCVCPAQPGFIAGWQAQLLARGCRQAPAHLRWGTRLASLLEGKGESAVGGKTGKVLLPPPMGCEENCFPERNVLSLVSQFFLVL